MRVINAITDDETQKILKAAEVCCYSQVAKDFGIPIHTVRKIVRQSKRPKWPPFDIG